jgi:DNA-directed RNA polymerase III subunit RPC1
VCTPFNADFDGDEMNIHVPQTLEARSETLHLMGVTQNIVTPKSGEPIIALIQDFLTTSFLITSRDVFFTRQEFTAILSWFTDANELIDLPPPTILKPAFLWTGKQVISAVLRPNRRARVVVNFTAKEKIYTGNEHRCLRDGWVLFRNSELLLGQIGKTTLGGNKTGLIYHLLRDNTNEIACEIMHRISKLSARWLSNYGMTIGLSDVTPALHLRSINKG